MTDLSQFSRNQLDRFQRHFSLAGFGPEAQAKLLKSRVLVIGAGGLGSPILTYLAAAGVGNIDMIDHDVVDRSNLHRQVIHSESDIGRHKTESAAEVMRGLHPEVRINEIRVPLTSQNAVELVEPVDLVIDGSDNFATRYVASDACEIAAKPLVSGSILRFAGQVSLFWSHPDPSHPGFEDWPAGQRGPTYRDLYPEAPDAGEVPTCAEAGVIGVLPGVIGSIMATEAVKFLAGIGKPLLGRVLNYDALSASFREVRLLPDPERAPVTSIGADVEGLGGFSPEASVSAPDPASESASAPACESAPKPEVTPGEIDPWTGDLYDEHDLGPREFLQCLSEGGAASVIDVREPWEYAVDHVEGAVNIPLGDIWYQQAEIPSLEEATEDKPIVLYCKIGVRSRQAMQMIRHRHPEAQLKNLVGGFSALKAQNVRV